MKLLRLTFILFGLLILNQGLFAQISPGDLAEPHAHLEGISNCTKCHELGEKVSDVKCLACHTELKARIDQKKGFHSSAKVYGKSCTTCHSDHLSKKYDIVHLDKNKFDHKDTGFLLEGKHKEKKCEDCHKAERIADPLIKKKKMTFLGLNTSCLSCHEDRHQKTLSVNCTDCHTHEAFKPASRFDHKRSDFQLKGQHKTVECKKCHEIGKLNGKDFQKFKGLQFTTCANCHKDIHDNQFGQNCTECHSEESFKTVKGISTFDHNKTNFKLAGKHQSLGCKTCHKVSLTAPLKHPDVLIATRIITRDSLRRKESRLTVSNAILKKDFRVPRLRSNVTIPAVLSWKVHMLQLHASAVIKNQLNGNFVISTNVVLHVTKIFIRSQFVKNLFLKADAKTVTRFTAGEM